MRRVRRLSNVPVILGIILLILLILAALVVVLGPGGGLTGVASHLPTPAGDASPPPPTLVRSTVAAVPTAPATEAPTATSAASPPPIELSPTSAPSTGPSPTSEFPTPTPVSAGSVRPIVECVTDNGDGTYTAYFGYHNDGAETVTISVGPRNRVSPAPESRGQPTTFSPGGTAPWPNAPFSAVFSGGSLRWMVEGRAATASPDSPRCMYRVQIMVKWYGNDGNPLAGPPEALPPGFSITAQSEIGSATCTYSNGSSLVCQYDNQSGAEGALLVPPGTSYTTDQSGLPAGWQIFSGVGVFPGSGNAPSVSHVIDNRAAGAPAPSPTLSPTPTVVSSDASALSPTAVSPPPATATEPSSNPPAAATTPGASETPGAGETPVPTDEQLPGAETPAAVAQITPTPSPMSLLPATGRTSRSVLLSVGFLTLGLALTIWGLGAIWRRRSD